MIRGARVLCALVSIALAAGTLAASEPEDDAVSRWKEDLAYLATELPEKHKNLFFSLSKEEFDSMVAALGAEIPKLTDVQIMLRLMKIVAAVGDGHTSIRPDTQMFRVMPLRFAEFRDGVYVVSTTAEVRDLFGGRVVGFGDVPVEAVLDEIRATTSHDNASGFKNAGARQLRVGDNLLAAGAWSSKRMGPVTLSMDGRVRTITMNTTPLGETAGLEWVSRSGPEPLFRLRSSLSHWNDWIPEHKTVYFKYNQCNKREEFEKLVDGTKDFIRTNPVERFILDLRDNGGGASVIFKPLLMYLKGHKKLNRPGHLYVIIGRRTFSSAILNAMEMRQTRAVFIGEPSGGKPNHYGEIRHFELPNSKLRVQYSTNYFSVIEEADPDSIVPDIVVEPTFADWLEGRDPVLEAVWADIEERRAAD